MRCLGKFGATAAILFLLTLFALRALRPDISVISNYVSDYANGPFGGFFETASFVHGIGNIAIAAGLWFVVAESQLGRWGVILFWVAAMGVIIAALFSTDPLRAPPTFAGTVHLTAVFASFFMEAVALFLLALAFKSFVLWRSFITTTTILGVFGSISLLLLLVFRGVGVSPGLAERAALLAFMAWEIVAAVRLAKAKL